ncbi:reverse transcriptase domain-containing protein [Tanacetum coccineum]
MIRTVSTKAERLRVSFPCITLSEDDPIPENYSGDDPLIITADVRITHIHRIYMDGGSSTKIMYEHCFKQLTSEEKEKRLQQMRLPTEPLVRFAGQISWPLGLIQSPYTSYHQIRMAKEDEEKTSFHIKQGTFCYEQMLFGLKNARASYQRLMDNVFASQLSRNITCTRALFGKVGRKVISILQDAESIEGSGAGLILTDPDGRVVTYAVRFNFRTSNSEAEYEALVAGLELAIQMEAQLLNVYTYSLLITNQVKGLYEAREEIMKRYLSKVQELQMHFRSFTITQISRSKNKSANALSILGPHLIYHLTKSVLVEIVPMRSLDVKLVQTINETGTTWMDPIITLLNPMELAKRTP